MNFHWRLFDKHTCWSTAILLMQGMNSDNFYMCEDTTKGCLCHTLVWGVEWFQQSLTWESLQNLPVCKKRNKFKVIIACSVTGNLRSQVWSTLGKNRESTSMKTCWLTFYLTIYYIIYFNYNKNRRLQHY